jgi:hypothetical protein
MDDGDNPMRNHVEIKRKGVTSVTVLYRINPSSALFIKLNPRL